MMSRLIQTNWRQFRRPKTSQYFIVGDCHLVIELDNGNLRVKVGANVSVTEGDDFKLICTDPTSQITDLVWSKVETINKGNHSVVLQLPLNNNVPSILEFRSVLLQDEGRYWCTDKVDEELTSVFLNIKAASRQNDGYRKPVHTKTTFANFKEGVQVDKPDKPELIILKETKNGQQLAPSTIIANLGDSMELTCVLKIFNGTIDHEVTWNKLEISEKGKHSHKTYIKKSLNGVEPSKLVLRPISLPDFGRYVCSKKNTKLYQSIFIKMMKSKPDVSEGVFDCKTSRTDANFIKIKDGFEAMSIVLEDLFKHLHKCRCR